MFKGEAPQRYGQLNDIALKERALPPTERDAWTLEQRGYEPTTEALFRRRACLSSGIIKSLPDLFGDRAITYVRGLYEKKPDGSEEEASNSPASLNIPDVFSFQFGKEKLTPEDTHELRRISHIRDNFLQTQFRLRDNEGKDADVLVTQFNNEARPHLAVMNISVIPDYDGTSSITVGINRDVHNKGEQFFEDKEPQDHSATPENTILSTETTKYNKHTIAIAQVGQVFSVRERQETTSEMTEDDKGVQQTFQFDVQKGKEYSLFVVSSIHTDVDKAIVEEGGSPVEACLRDVDALQATDFDTLFQEHTAIRKERWEHMDVKLVGDEDVEKALRFNASHLSPELFADYPYAGLGAKIGNEPFEGYGERHFWDGMIYNPFVTKSLMEYMGNLLPSAQTKAEKYGFSGAFWPWEAHFPPQDGKDGEGCPERIFNKELHKVIPVEAIKEEIHITADVIYTLNEYYKTAGDKEFMAKKGVEMMLEASRFYRSRGDEPVKGGPIDFVDITGPDEYHPKVKTNAYTNLMAKWTIRKSLEMFGEFPHDANRAGLTKEEYEDLKDFQERITIPFDQKTLVFEAFDGWHDLEDIDLTQPPYQGVTAMDGKLREERSPQDKPIEEMSDVEISPVRGTKVIKQHDTTLAINLLREEIFDLLPSDAQEALRRRGMKKSQIMEMIAQANYAEYSPRVCDGSSLSPNKGVEIALDAGVEPDEVYDIYKKAVLMDLHANTHKTEEGLHTAAMGGSLQTTIRGFGGIKVREDALTITPRMPSRWEALTTGVQYAGEHVRVHIDNNEQTVTVTLDEESTNEVPVKIAGSEVPIILNSEYRQTPSISYAQYPRETYAKHTSSETGEERDAVA